jgi:hypothetical protein
MNECYKIALINFSEGKSIAPADEQVARILSKKAQVAEKRV